MTMKLQTHTTADSFLLITQAALQEDEVANNLMLGIALRLKQTPDAYPSKPYLATVSDGARLSLAALMTPPHPLTLFRPRAQVDDAYGSVVRDLLANRWPVHAVSGRVPVPAEFARVWSRLTGAEHRVNVHMRVYELRNVIPAPPVSGRLLRAEETDLNLVAQWAVEFIAEALPHDDPSTMRETMQRRIAAGDIFLWEDGGRLVSMAARSRPMMNGGVVSLVYTPPPLRGRGYATACVAALSQRLLDAGWTFCALFTDLGNPTSNSIYQKIGYKPVCDFDEYGLGEPRHIS